MEYKTGISLDIESYLAQIITLSQIDSMDIITVLLDMTKPINGVARVEVKFKEVISKKSQLRHRIAVTWTCVSK